MARRPVDFGRLRGLIRPRQALELHGWQPTSDRGPTLMRGPCPVHGSRANSRSLTVTDRVCYCHSCHWSGDAVAIHARLSGQDMLAAAYHLCTILHITVPVL